MLVMAALFAAAVLACGQEAEQAETPTRPVALTRVLVATIEERIEASGELQAKDRAQIAAEIGRASCRERVSECV